MTEGVEVEIVKNTYKTYDNFVNSGQISQNGTFYTLDQTNVHSDLGKKPMKTSGEVLKWLTFFLAKRLLKPREILFSLVIIACVGSERSRIHK